MIHQDCLTWYRMVDCLFPMQEVGGSKPPPSNVVFVNWSFCVFTHQESWIAPSRLGHPCLFGINAVPTCQGRVAGQSMKGANMWNFSHYLEETTVSFLQTMRMENTGFDVRIPDHPCVSCYAVNNVNYLRCQMPMKTKRP
jgi:hypothetical protein